MTPSLAEPNLGRRDGTFRHEAFLYCADEEFVGRVTDFVREGLLNDEAVVVAEPHRLDQVRDAVGEESGSIHDPLVGRRVPNADRAGGRGLHLVNPLCDLVQLRSWAGATELRLTTWR